MQVKAATIEEMATKAIETFPDCRMICVVQNEFNRDRVWGKLFNSSTYKEKRHFLYSGASLHVVGLDIYRKNYQGLGGFRDYIVLVEPGLEKEVCADDG